MKTLIKALFDGDFVLSKQNEELLPAEATASKIKETFKKGASVISMSLTEFQISLTHRKDEDIKKAVSNIFENLYGIKLKDGRNSVLEAEKAVIFEFSAQTDGKSKEDIQKSINSLIGWDEFKKLCFEIAQIAPEIEKHKTENSFLFQNYLFSVNDGCGLTTALKYFCDFIENLSLFTFSEEAKFAEITLTPKESVGKLTPEIAVQVLTDEANFNKLICFDICEYMDKSHRNELKEFLESLVPLEGKYIFCFRIPFVEPDALKKIYNVLSDILYVRRIPVPPLENRQLKEYAVRILKSYGFSAETMAWDIFFSRICEEKSDGRFYEFQSVKKIVYEMLWLKHKSDAVYLNKAKKDAKKEHESSVIKRDEILELSPSYSEKPVTGFDELDDLVGLEDIKTKIKETVAQVKFIMADKNAERPCLHMRFVGPPGTGKTTVARILGKIFRENGILRNGYFFEYMSRDLCGEFVGQTAPKTSAACRDAYGSVMFIDEAYALYNGDKISNDYGREALTTLISEMENHRDDMVVIMAGYKKDMEQLMEANTGLRSRMPFLFEFKSYNKDELLKIYMKMVSKQFECDDTLYAEAKKYFDALDKKVLESPDFANARFVRNLFERTWSKGAMRASLNNESKVVLTAEDFKSASGEKEFSEKLQNQKNPIGFQKEA